jgi:hemolysin-activating ACP:hemolysin acyltransferase
MDFIFDKDKLKDMHEVISLYKRFDRYKDLTREDLYYHILPSFKLNQYKIHKDKNDMIAFTNWAYLDKDAENRFISTGILEGKDWKSGDNVWHIDTVCAKNIKKVMSWTRKYFTNLLGNKQTCSLVKYYLKMVKYIEKPQDLQRRFINNG